MDPHPGIGSLNHWVFTGVLLAGWTIPASAAPDPQHAAKVFSEAEAICQRDNGELWGRSLCGPMFLVDYRDRRIIANEADTEHQLVREGQYFVGTLPSEIVIANTPTDWAGRRWTQLVSPVYEEDDKRHVLIAHELFHRIQRDLGLSRPEASNQHLDTIDGRYFLQLEWRALERALMAADDAGRLSATSDAIAFRRARYSKFPGAADDEAVLEINEGIPEYTGVRLGLTDAQSRKAYVIRNLHAFVDAPTFVRSFAYATGPAYGLLLDEADPDWLVDAGSKERFDQLLAAALAINEPDSGQIPERIARYDNGALLSAEQKRDREKQERLAAYKARLVDGPVLILPLAKSNFQFNPQTLTPLQGYGMIYPTLGLKDNWGSLQVETGGALVRKQPRQATVSASGVNADGTVGAGWRLTLAKGWTIVPAERKGDLTLVCADCPE